jgi:uncharacterized membrane protein
MKHFAALALLALLFVAACTSTPSGAVCPTENAPTYASFGKTFFTTYCTDCHSATTGDRHGAPAGLDFDTEAEIQAHATDSDVVAAAGPNNTNTAMPQTSPLVKTMPTQAERDTLGQFLACENSSH